MRKILCLLTVALCGLILVESAYGQDDEDKGELKKVGQTGLQFLKADMSARAAGMGGAFIMVSNDANAMFYNPAGLAQMQTNFDAFGTMTQWIAGITYNAVGIAGSAGSIGHFGLTLISASYGDDIDGTRLPLSMDSQAEKDAGYVKTGSLDVSALAVGVVYARQISSKFFMGGQVRYASQHLGSSILEEGGDEVENKVGGLSYEFGSIFYPGLVNSFRFGMSIRNFSPQFKYEQDAFQLPLTFTIGVAADALEFLGMEGGSHSLLVAIDALHPRDYTERVHLGLEYWFMDMVALRGGYKFNYDEESITFGGGIKYGVGGIALKIDGAYSAFGVFDNVTRFTVGVSF